MNIAPFPLIEIGGAPFARGRQYGEAAAERVQRSVRLYAGQLERMALGRDEIRELVQGVIPAMEAFQPDYVEEMKGIAEGAGCSLDDVALINARTEILELARRRTGTPEEEDGCTGVVVLPEAARDGQLIHAQNWDWRPECVESAIVLKIRREDGPDLITFTEAGGLARSGFNAAGLAITANYLESSRDYQRSGIPLPLIRRKFLESAHLAHGIKTVAATPKSASNNMMLSSAEGFAVDFECAPDEAFPLYPQDGLLVHANHWVSPVALSKLVDTGIANTPDSVYRDYRVHQLLAPEIGEIGVDDVKAALFDDFAAPYAVCRPSRPGSSGSISATVAMIVMQPALGRLEVAPLPAFNRQFGVYLLEMETAARQVA
jgi:isopenicillin-N N-acyltransferase-like protein